MSPYRVSRQDVTAVLLVATIALAVFLFWPRHHPTIPAAAAAPDTAAVTLTYSTVTHLPADIARAISSARMNAAAACPARSAEAWAEIDEHGVVLGIHTACAAHS